MKCRQCGKEFDGHGNAKYCPDCKKIVQHEQQRLYNRRYRENHRKQRPKPVEKIRPLTKDDLHQLLTLIRDAYQAGWLILTFGGQSALTDEQLAVVEQKYPEHRQTLGDKRKQKFFDAADKFIELYQSFK